MDSETRRAIRWLRAYAVGTTSLLLVLGLAAFRETQRKPHFDEIDVERINVVEPDGKLRMVISNRTRSPGPIAYGKPFGYPGGSRPGIIFYNDEETENGGLTFGGKRDADGTFHAVGHLSFDQYDQDQVVVLQYSDDNGERRMGLAFNDRADVPITELAAQMDSIRKMPDGPEKSAARAALMKPRNGQPLFARRLFVGRDAGKDAVITLGDKLGNTRLRLLVDSSGTASLDFLDAEGHVVYSLPDSARRGR